MKILIRRVLLFAVLLAAVWVHAAERMPPAPAKYFNDYAGTVAPATADGLNRQLEQYERESSNQLLVVIYPKMETDSSVEDYTVRVAQSWRAGQKGKNNGAVLFVFKEDRQLYIQVGYGLEPTLTDATCHDIIENILKPRFRQGNFDLGLSEAVTAMIAATKGEYAGTGHTQAESGARHGNSPISFIFIGIVLLIVVLNVARRARNPAIFMNPNRRSSVWWGMGGNSGGSGWGGGGGGGFSGGGGSFGGGGAGGKW